MEKIICFSEKGDYINNSINIDKTNINIVKQLIVQFNDENFIRNFEELKEEYNKYKNLHINIIKYVTGDVAQFNQNFSERFSLIALYKDTLKEIVTFKIKSDDEIIKKSLFILYSCYLGDEDQIKDIANCLVVSSKDGYFNSNKIYIGNFPQNLDMSELCMKNLNLEINWNNLLLNHSKYFKYPYILKKNTLMNIGEIYNSFIKYIKEIYKSNLMKEIYSVIV